MSNQRQPDNKQRAYSRLNPTTGAIEWVYPGESLRDRLNEFVRNKNANRRSRLETDDEVKARIKALPHAVVFKDDKGDRLDRVLKQYGLEPRKIIDEVVS